MKRNIIVLIFLVLTSISAFTGTSYGATTTSLKDDIQQQVDDLKSKIASKVAELNLVEKRGIAGTVTDSSDTQITLSDLKGNTRLVDVDEITKFSSTEDSFGISDIKKGDFLGILGIYNKDSKRLLAREIRTLSPFPKVIFGGIKKLDSKNFEITIVKENGQSLVASVENVTKTYSFEDKELVKSGFSKMTVGETIIVVGLPDAQNKTKMVASRIFLFPDVDVSSRINLTEGDEVIIPSTGSGKKLTPITR